MEHAYSPGGLTMLEMVRIDQGYWRATPSSLQILACYNANACLGGLTEAPGFCLDGYEGPCKWVTLPTLIGVISHSFIRTGTGNDDHVQRVERTELKTKNAEPSA